jgi:hypothetical protein
MPVRPEFNRRSQQEPAALHGGDILDGLSLGDVPLDTPGELILDVRLGSAEAAGLAIHLQSGHTLAGYQ